MLKAWWDPKFAITSIASILIFADLPWIYLYLKLLLCPWLRYMLNLGLLIMLPIVCWSFAGQFVSHFSCWNTCCCLLDHYVSICYWDLFLLKSCKFPIFLVLKLSEFLLDWRWNPSSCWVISPPSPASEMPQTARHTTPQSPAWGLGCRYWKKQHLKPFWKSPLSLLDSWSKEGLL